MFQLNFPIRRDSRFAVQAKRKRDSMAGYKTKIGNNKI